MSWLLVGNLWNLRKKPGNNTCALLRKPPWGKGKGKGSQAIPGGSKDVGIFWVSWHQKYYMFRRGSLINPHLPLLVTRIGIIYGTVNLWICCHLRMIAILSRDARSWHCIGQSASQGWHLIQMRVPACFVKLTHCRIILLMDEILHELIGSLSHYFQGFYTFQVVIRISSINSTKESLLTFGLRKIIEIWVLVTYM